MAIWQEEEGESSFGWSAYPSVNIPVAIVAGFLAVAVIIALAIFAASASATQSEAATHSALGMTIADSRRSRVAQFTIPLVIGTALGTGIGFLVSLVNAVVNGTLVQESIGWQWLFAALPHVAISILTTVGIAVLFIAIGAGIVAITTSRRTPVDNLALVS